MIVTDFLLFFKSNVRLDEGQCVWINTGAKLPDDANAVVQIEDTVVHERHDEKINGFDEKSIRVKVRPSLGQDIRFVYLFFSFFNVTRKVHRKIFIEKIPELTSTHLAARISFEKREEESWVTAIFSF